MPKLLSRGLIVLLLLALVPIFTFFSQPESPTAYSANRGFAQDYAIYSAPIPAELNFAGERIPIEDPQIRQAFDRELLVNTYWQSHTVLFLKRAARHFPIIEPILREEGIPEDFKYLPLIESGLMDVVSPAGATGIWQIMESTGEDYGLEINRAVDERYHLAKATRVACLYLKEAKEEFGNWTMAAAAYNMGIRGLKSQLERQAESDYYSLVLNPETGRYLYRLLAVKEIMTKPERYGFYVEENEKYQPIPVREIAVDTPLTHVKYFNRQFGINYRILKYHNPWLRLEHLPNPGRKTYLIEVPEAGHHYVVEKNSKEGKRIDLDQNTAKPDSLDRKTQ